VDIPDPSDAAQVIEPALAVTDHLKEIFDQVDGAHITQLMRDEAMGTDRAQGSLSPWSRSLPAPRSPTPDRRTVAS
jgi:hypothetical protein